MGAVGLSFQPATYLANLCDQRKGCVTFSDFGLLSIWICELGKHICHLLQCSAIHSDSLSIFVLVKNFIFTIETKNILFE